MQQQLGRLTDSHVRLFLAIVLRNPSVFVQMAEHLTPEAFADGGLRMVWQTALLRYQLMRRPPTGPEMSADLAAAPTSASLELTFNENYQTAIGFVDWAYHPHTFRETAPDAPEMVQCAFHIGRLLLLRTQTDALLRELPNVELTELPSMLEQAQTRANAASTFDLTVGRQPVFSEGWDTERPLTLRTTGFSFLDRYMVGGEAAGEVYLFMAPMGTCKTTFSVMKWVASGRQAYANTFDPAHDGRIGLSFLVSYEASLASELRHRALSYSARIHKDRLQLMGQAGLSALNDDPDRPLPYEEALFSREIADGLFIPERRRIQAEIGWINQHLVCIDLSGADTQLRDAGNGGLWEIIRRVEGILRMSGPQYYAESIVVDYLGLMVNRYLNTLPARNRKEPHDAYPETIGEARKELALKFGCPVWFMHQLSGEANAVLNVTRRMHHTQGKGAKMVGENTDFTFVVGNLTGESVGVLDCTKHRRSRPMARTIVKIEGDFNNIVSLDNHTIDSRGRIVDRATQEQANARASRSAPRLAASALVSGEPAEGDDFAEIENG